MALKRYVQMNFSRNGNVLTVKDLASGATTLMTIASPLPNSPPHVVHDDNVGDHIPLSGIGIDGTGAYFDPTGDTRGEEAVIALDKTGAAQFKPSPYRGH